MNEARRPVLIILLIGYYLWWGYLAWLYYQLSETKMSCGMPYIGLIVLAFLSISIGSTASIIGIALSKDKARKDFVICLIAAILPLIFGWLYVLF